MKILFMNQTFYPDLAATAQVLTDAAVRLAQEGHEVTVLTGRRGYLAPHPLYPAREEYRRVKIIRVSPFIFGRGNKFMRILDALILNAAFAIKLFSLPKFDRVVAMTTPPLVAWVALVFSRLQKTKFTYWLMDINPDQAIKAGWIRENSLEAKLLARVLKYVLRRSDRLIVLDRFMKQVILEKGAASEKISIIPPCVDETGLQRTPHAENPFRKRHQLNGKFTVMYSGNLSVCHPLDTLLNAALLLKDDPSIIFVLIGEGERTKGAIQFKEKHHLSNLRLLPYQEASELRHSLSAADLHVVVMGSPYVGIVHPSKIYRILALGSPFVFIGPENSPIGELMTSHGMGRQVDHGDVEGLIRVIREARNLPDAARGEMTQKSFELENSMIHQENLTRILAG